MSYHDQAIADARKAVAILEEKLADIQALSMAYREGIRSGRESIWYWTFLKLSIRKGDDAMITFADGEHRVQVDSWDGNDGQLAVRYYSKRGRLLKTIQYIGVWAASHIRKGG